MIIPAINITGGQIESALADKSNSMTALALSESINIHSPAKPYSRTFKPSQIAGSKHGLYRPDGDGRMLYNKPQFGSEPLFGSDFIGYNSDAEPSSKFVITHIFDGSSDVYDPVYGTTLYFSLTYEVHGLLVRGAQSINPEAVCPYTKWTKQTGNNYGYGGICFNVKAGADVDPEMVFDVTDTSQEVIFSFKPGQYVAGPVRPFNVWYAFRDANGYHATIYPLENDWLREPPYNVLKHWYDGIIMSPFLLAGGGVQSGRTDENHPWIQKTFINNFTDRDFQVTVSANIAYPEFSKNFFNDQCFVNGVAQKVEDWGQVNIPNFKAGQTIVCKFIFTQWTLNPTILYPDFHIWMENTETGGGLIGEDYVKTAQETDYPT